MLTLDQLRAFPACSEALEAFEARWPDGKARLRDVVLALAEHPDGPEWWEWLAPRVPALRPALEAYAAATRSEWEAFMAALRQAQKAYAAAVRPAISDAALLLPEESAK